METKESKESKFDLSIERLIDFLLPEGMRSGSVRALLRAAFVCYHSTLRSGADTSGPKRPADSPALRTPGVAPRATGSGKSAVPSVPAGGVPSVPAGAVPSVPAGAVPSPGESRSAKERFSKREPDLSERFARARAEDRFRLRHNGQVCYLRAALNKRFRSGRGLYFRIGELYGDLEWLYAQTENREANPLKEHIYARTEHPSGADASAVEHIYAPNETKLRPTNSFIIFVPADIYDTKLDQVRRFVDAYRLVTRTPQFEPINS